MRPGPGHVDTCTQQVGPAQRRHRRRTDRAPGCGGAKEQMAVGRLRAAMTEVVENRLTDYRRKRERRRVAGLALGDPEAVVLPVDVVQAELRDLPGAKAVGDEEEQYRIVPPPGLASAIDTGEHPVDVIPGDRAGDVGEPVDLGPADGAGKICPVSPLPMGVAQEYP